MFGHWFVIADQTTVRIYTENPVRGKLKCLKTFVNPLGKERNRNLIRKQAGLSVRSIGRGRSVRQTQSERHHPHEDAANQFAREVAQYLDRTYKKEGYKNLTLVAEPRFLGRLRSALSKQTNNTVIECLEKDLCKTPPNQFPTILKLNKKK